MSMFYWFSSDWILIKERRIIRAQRMLSINNTHWAILLHTFLWRATNECLLLLDFFLRQVLSSVPPSSDVQLTIVIYEYTRLCIQDVNLVNETFTQFETGLWPQSYQLSQLLNKNILNFLRATWVVTRYRVWYIIGYYTHSWWGLHTVIN